MTGVRADADRAAQPRWWPWRIVGVCSVVSALAVGGVAVFTSTFSSATSHRIAAKAPDRHHTKHAKPNVRTFLGPDGVESSAIIAENELPGTSAWLISGQPATGMIEGFANTTYSAAGQSVTLYVSTTSSEFTVTAYRMGYYQGLGARQIWRSGEDAGLVQPACPLTAGINLVSCDNWTPSLTIPITSSWVQGDYLLKLVGSDNKQSYVLLTIWNPSSTATYVLIARSLTEEGWNSFGGFDYYTGSGPCTLGQRSSYPQCNRARVVSFDRPYASGNGASDFVSNEYPLVRFMEEHGLDAAYVTDVTVDQNPSILLKHKAILSLGHDETWTFNERLAAQTAVDHGVNLIFFGAAAALRHARLQSSPSGADREEVDYRDSSEDPLNGVPGDAMEVTGNTFSSPPTDLSEDGLVGEVYSGYLSTSPVVDSAPFVVEDASAWIFNGTGLQDGSSIPGVIESDFDHIVPSDSMPTNIEVLGHSPIPLTEAFTGEGGWAGKTYSDMTYYTNQTSEAGVFDSGTVNWINAITPCATPTTPCAASEVQQITGNLLWLFGQGRTGAIDPSVANWQSVSPPGS
jgi:hypothetical protein